MKKNWPKLRLNEKATERLVKMPKRHLTQFENILILPKAIVPLITHSRFTSPVIQRNLAQFISKHRESVVFLVFFVKQYTVKLIFLIDEAVAVGKGEIQRSDKCTTSFNAMVLVKPMSIYTWTTVVGKTKTTSSCGSLCGGLSLNFTSPFFIHFF